MIMTIMMIIFMIFIDNSGRNERKGKWEKKGKWEEKGANRTMLLIIR